MEPEASCKDAISRGFRRITLVGVGELIVAEFTGSFLDLNHRSVQAIVLKWSPH